MKLHQYQYRAVNFGLKSKQVFNMVDLGLGKTAIALTLGSVIPYPMFVFAPLNVAYSTWPEEIKKWTPNRSYTILHGKNKDSNLRLKRNIYLINYEGIKWFYNACCTGKFNVRKFFMVFDESSMVKSYDTKRFWYLKKMMSMYSEFRMNLSATPMPNSLHELWPQYYLLDAGKRLGKIRGHFMNKLFIETGPPKFKTFPKRGTTNYIYSKVQDITYRLKGSDYIKLPPVTYNTMPLHLSDRESKQYTKIEKQYLLELEGSVVPLDSDASAMAKSHQYVQGAVYTDAAHMRYTVVQDHKAQALKELIQTTGGRPMLVSIWYKFEYEMICNVLGYSPPIIAGGTNPSTMQLYLKRWNAGQLPLLLVHPVSVKFGLNLQAGGNLILWYSLTWSLEAYTQLIGRLVRQGQQNAVIIHHFVMKNTIDEVFMRVLPNKEANQSDMLNAMKLYMAGKYH